MRTFILYAAALLSVAVACQAGFGIASDMRWAAGDEETAIAANGQKTAPEAPLPSSGADTQPAAPSHCDTGCGGCGECESCCCCCATQCCSAWTIDWLVRPYFNSHTSYQFGTNPGFVPVYDPVSKLDWKLDSTWTGLRIGKETDTRGIHFEWLTPMQRGINGNIADFDWMTPADPSHLDSLTLSSERWNEGQMIDIGAEFKLTDCTLGMPIEIWPMLGFRWQRFCMTATGIDYIINPDGPPGPDPAYEGVDVLTMNQQYYMLYVGGQLRTDVCLLGRPVALTFQGDWAGTWGASVDHHLVRPGGDLFVMQYTSGGAMHVGLTAETQLTNRLFIGLSADPLALTAPGIPHWYYPSEGEDEWWTNGVKQRSDQTSLTVFLRGRF